MNLLAVIDIGTEGCSDRLTELIGKYFIFSLAEVLECRDWMLGLKTFEWWIFSMRKQLTYLGLVEAGPLVWCLPHSKCLRETHASLNWPMHTMSASILLQLSWTFCFFYIFLPAFIPYFLSSFLPPFFPPSIPPSFFPLHLKKIEMDRCAELGRRIVSLGPVWAMYQVQG